MELKPRGLRASAVGENENVTGLGDPKDRVKHEIVAGNIERSDGLAAHTGAREQCAHLRLHQTLPPNDRPQPFMQIGDVDMPCTFDQSRIEAGNSFVHH
jgi:hypothetical protein